jgi:FlaA1/EpsC-like NDP-sugar epimerase
MGEPVRIMDLAVNMIHLSGFEVDDIGIEITGLRPGEKMYEELAMDSELETRKTTELEKIFVNQPMEINPITFREMLKELEGATDENVRSILKKYVPNYNPADN